MEKRYKKFVYEDVEGKRTTIIAKEDTVFEMEETQDHGIIIKNKKRYPDILAGQCAEELSRYTDKDGNKALIAPGWTVSGIETENTIWGKDVSLVLYCIPKEEVCGIDWENPDELEALQKTYDQLIWIPVELLPANGTVDGIHFDRKFGRRNNRNDKFSEQEFHEESAYEIICQIDSAKMNGGFYISRYKISGDSLWYAKSVKGKSPWVNLDHQKANMAGMKNEEKSMIVGHLTSGSEYDTIQEWLVQTGTISRKQLQEGVEEIKEYLKQNGAQHQLINNIYQYDLSQNMKKLASTGSGKPCNNLYDFITEGCEWTQEHYGNTWYNRTIRCCGNALGKYIIGHRYATDYEGIYGSPNWNERVVGFRRAFRIDVH